MMDEPLLEPLTPEEPSPDPEDFGDIPDPSDMRAILGLPPKGETPPVEEPEPEEALEEESEPTPEPQEPAQEPPNARNALLEELRSLRAEVAALRGPQSPPPAPQAPEPLPVEPQVFVTDDDYEEAVKDGPSLNRVLNSVYQKAVADTRSTVQAELPRMLSEYQAQVESVKSAANEAGQRFYVAHKADMEYVNADPRRQGRFLAEVQRVQATHPELLQSRQYDQLYGLALEHFNALKADFAAADGNVAPKGGTNAPKPAFATTPGARGGLRRTVAKADDAVSEMQRVLGLKPKNQ